MDFDEGKRIQQQSQPIQPFKFIGKDPINPFYKMDEHPNDNKRFAILRTTENGKYVRGGMLFFRMNGVEIYTEIDNIIFVDLINNTCTVKQYKNVAEEIAPQDPEERQYILLMKCYENDEEIYFWESMTGRTETYNYIVDNIESLNIDPDNSFVLVDTVPYKDALSISGFVRYLKNAEIIEDDGFDIDDFIVE